MWDRWATRGGMQEAAKMAGVTGAALNNPVALAQGRSKMYRPGGPIARMLARNPTILVVNDTLFAHGGVLPEHGEVLALAGVQCVLVCSAGCQRLARMANAKGACAEQEAGYHSVN